MVWNASHLLWDQQILLLWILLPPVFIACGFLSLVAPLYLFRRNKPEPERHGVLPPAGAAVRSRA